MCLCESVGEIVSVRLSLCVSVRVRVCLCESVGERVYLCVSERVSVRVSVPV